MLCICNTSLPYVERILSLLSKHPSFINKRDFRREKISKSSFFNFSILILKGNDPLHNNLSFFARPLKALQAGITPTLLSLQNFSSFKKLEIGATIKYWAGVFYCQRHFLHLGRIKAQKLPPRGPFKASSLKKECFATIKRNELWIILGTATGRIFF